MNTEAAAPGPEDEAPLDELTARFVEVTRRLSGFAEIADEEADGFLTAVVLLPQPLPMSEWLPAFVEDDAFERCFADTADADAARATLEAYLARIARALDPQALLESPEHLGLQPLMNEWSAERRERIVAEEGQPELAPWLFTGAAWAHGLMRGINAFLDQTPVLSDGKSLRAYEDALDAITALVIGDSGEAWEEHVQSNWRGKPPTRDQLIDAALVAVEDIRLIWLGASLKPVPRISDKVGRNDPCPCGSGKKFKKCHGSA